MVSAFDLKALAVVCAAGDVEDHGVVEEVWPGEAEQNTQPIPRPPLIVNLPDAI